MSADQTPTQDQGPSILAQVSNEMVRIYKEQFGRGPGTSRASWSTRDVLIVLLEDTLTPAEYNLTLLGEHERLREMRIFLQYASVHAFCEPVERLTGRKVRAFISGIDTAVDGISIETFVMYPRGAEDGPSRTELAVA
jgi:uncharacterized protein YbcI